MKLKPLYISATRQDSGKTSVICGLIQNLRHIGQNPGYIKPVGQRYVQYEGKNIDEDTVLAIEAFGFKDTPSDMSPVAIPRGFTSQFILNPDVSPLKAQIQNSFDKLRQKHQMLIVEGTGHAGVGSCFGLSNAEVAKMLDAKVVIVTTGGIGRPLDEVAQSLSLFREKKVDVLGVILNKVVPEKMEKIQRFAGKGFELLGTRLLGTIPFDATLSFFTVGQIADELDYDILCGNDTLANRIEHTVVAAMEPQNVLNYLKRNAIIITPGDRIDNILLTLALAESASHREELCSGGLILTGGLKPDSTILSLLLKSSIPVLLTKDDTFLASAKMKDLHFKIKADDKYKIELTRKLVAENIDIDSILGMLDAGE